MALSVCRMALLLLFVSAVIVLFDLRLLDKGKPPEKVGRKATGLSPARKRDTAAGLPGKRSTFGSVLVVFRPNGSVMEGAMIKTNGSAGREVLQ